jgi:transposase
MKKATKKIQRAHKMNKTNKTKRPQTQESVKQKDETMIPQHFDPAIFEMLNPNAAGIDVATEEMWVCVPAGRTEPRVRKFGAFTDDLYALADFLKDCRITSVAMESTGVYWIPLYQVLESRGFDVCLTNSRHLKNVSGRPKTDRLDCQWIQRLHSYGFLKASFRPHETICQIRSIQRHRDSLIRQASQHVQHMQKAFHQMNVLLPKVIKDITGVTGMAIIEHILAGERDPVRLAQLRNPHCKSSEEEMAKALKGDYRREHLFVLRQAHTAYHFVHEQIWECDQEIEELLTTIAKQVDASLTPPPPRTKAPQANRKNMHEFVGDARTLLYECFGVDITEITGIDTTNGLVLYTEVGADLGDWETSKHFTSWLGLSPNTQSSGGKVKSSHTRKVANRASQAFRMAAKATAGSKTFLGAFYRRMKARVGPSKAMTATARKIAAAFYEVVSSKTPFHDLGEAFYATQHRDRTLKRLKRQAKLLGYTLVEQQT